MPRRTQSELQSVLEGVLGSRHVYFQPPADLHLEYPCIVYQRQEVPARYADNKRYAETTQYQVTLIDYDPDSEVIGRLLELRHCGFDRHFTSDHLNHDVFTLYF
jgi:hypothetical protein